MLQKKQMPAYTYSHGYGGLNNAQMVFRYGAGQKNPKLEPKIQFMSIKVALVSLPYTIEQAR